MNTSRLLGAVGTAILGGAAASFSTVSSADSGPPSISVRFADLSLSKPSDARVLYQRIQAAARGACSYYWFERDADQTRCVEGAIAAAVTRINRSELSAVYDAKHGIPLPNTLVSQSR
jgi:UrcA family protein